MILKTFIKQFDDYSIAKIKLNLNILNTNKLNSNPLNSNKSNSNLLNINKLNLNLLNTNKSNSNLLNTNKLNSNPLNSNKSNSNLINTNKLDLLNVNKAKLNKLNGPLDSSVKNKIIKILANLEYININFKNFISHQKTSAETFTYKPNTTDIFFETQNINNNIIKNENIATISKFQNLRDLKTACKNIIKTYSTSIHLGSELLYFEKKSLILVTHTNLQTESEISALLSEFNATTEKGKFQEAIVKEYCKPIFLSHAIEKISML